MLSGMCSRKRLFKSIYSIIENCVSRLSELLHQSQTPNDKKGQRLKANTTKPEILKAIHLHIFSFPRKLTHYSSKKVEDLYLTCLYLLSQKARKRTKFYNI